MSITTRVMVLAAALLLSTVLPARDDIALIDNATRLSVSQLDSRAVSQAACWTVSIVLGVLAHSSTPATDASAPASRRSGQRPLMPFYSFVSAPAAAARES